MREATLEEKKLYSESCQRNLKLSFGDGSSLDNNDIYEESMSLEQSICSEDQLVIGKCSSACFKTSIANKGKSYRGLIVTPTINSGGFDRQLGVFTIKEEKISDDKASNSIVAYDDLYRIMNSDVSDWYNALSFPLSLKDFRNSFFEYFGVQHETVSLVNDSMVVGETIKPSELPGKTVIEAICELNGCFGQIGWDGIFKYVFLPELGQGLYPSETLYPDDLLFPMNDPSEEIGENGAYRNATYEDYNVKEITKLQIRQQEGDIGVISGIGDNCYIVENNFLVYGKTAEELATVADRLYSVISKISAYTPCEINLRGNPCIEVGDAIILNTRNKSIETYVLHRTLTGIQALTDTYSATGSECREEKVNSLNKQIIQLRGKTNALTRTVEETRLEIKDIESNLSSQISQTASAITAEVKRAQGQEVELAAAIKINTDNILLKVSKGNVSSEISQESDKITIKSNRLRIESTNFTLSEDGTVKAQNVDLSGKITANDGKIGGFTIGNSAIYSGAAYIGGSGIYVGDDGISCGDNFKVTSVGKVTAKDLDISGGKIGGFTIGDSAIYSDYAIFGRSGVYVSSILGISCGSDFEVSASTGDLKLKKISYAGSERMNFSTGVSISSGAVLCGSGKTLGFFGNNGTAKKTVSKIYSTSSTNISEVAKVLNNLIDALKSYNLIG